MEGKTVSLNRRAWHDYDILESLEAGLVLTGTEVKSLRLGRVSLGQGYVHPQEGELWLEGVHIPPYEGGGPYNHPPLRSRKLLLCREEIDRLIGRVSAKGLTIVPLKLYFKGGRAKLEIGLARGKKLYDKRKAIKEKEIKRETERALKGKRGKL